MDTTTTLYTKPGCVQCTATKRALDAAGITYNEFDVSTDTAALERVKALGFMAAPVVTVEPAGDAWSGFRPDKLQRLEQQAVTTC